MFEDLALFATPPRELPFAAAVFVLVGAAVFGSLWGSFLNVVIARVPMGLSVVTPRSRCPKCEKMIEARDNVPILSWILLRAKCRNCATPISARYPFIEFLGGIAGAACVARYGVSLPAVELFIFILTLVAISFIDLDTFTVPLGLVAVLVLNGLLFGVARWQLIGEAGAFGLEAQDVIDRLIGGVGAGLMLSAVVVLATYAIRRLQPGRLPDNEWAMGWGDPLIIAGLGANLGWQLMPLALFLASTTGAIVGIAVRDRLKNRAPIVLPGDDPWTPPDGAVPFGPFLALGGLMAAFFGDAILAYVLPLMGLGNALGSLE